MTTERRRWWYAEEQEILASDNGSCKERLGSCIFRIIDLCEPCGMCGGKGGGRCSKVGMGSRVYGDSGLRYRRSCAPLPAAHLTPLRQLE